MSKNQDKTICCRVNQDTYNLLEAITDYKKVKLSTYLRDVLDAAMMGDLRTMNVLTSSSILDAVKSKDATNTSTDQEQEEAVK